MKKIALLLMVLSLCASYGQKKKKPKAAAPKTPVIITLATNADSKVFQKKTDIFLVVGKDTMALATKKDKAPTNCKISPVKIKANTFYCVTWNENLLTDTKDKKEDIKITESQIWNPITKTLLIGNTQKDVNVTEIQYLDRLKTASQTVYKKRSEGYLFTLLGNGDFTLSNKSSSTKYSYNEKSSRYEPKKR
jgi:hypothetical protein